MGQSIEEIKVNLPMQYIFIKLFSHTKLVKNLSLIVIINDEYIINRTYIS